MDSAPKSSAVFPDAESLDRFAEEVDFKERGSVSANGFSDENECDEDMAESPKRKCCNALRFSGVIEAQGYALVNFGTGGLIMSNLFLSAALLRLASEAAGCIFVEENESPECHEHVYGFKPSSLITIIALVSGLIAAFLMPVIGAMLDFTSHRHLLGVSSAAFITIVQGVQIWLTDRTWFPMAILQAINGFCFLVQTMTNDAYLPELGRDVGAGQMTWFTALFTITRYIGEAAYLVVIIGASYALRLGDVRIAQMSQAFSVLWLVASFIPGWMKLPKVSALHRRSPGRNLAVTGFAQVWNTVKGINKHYRNGLQWFFLAVSFSVAAADAFTAVAVTFSVEVLGMTGTQVGIAFFIALVGAIPGAALGQWVSNKTSPVASGKISLLLYSATTVAASFTLTGPDRQSACYVFAGIWGVFLGWLFPTLDLIFSLSTPKGQESEISGFYTYCRSILLWLPPLIFTVMNEHGLHMRWGLMSLAGFLMIGCIFLQLMAPWDEVLDAAKTNKMTVSDPEDVPTEVPN